MFSLLQPEHFSPKSILHELCVTRSWICSWRKKRKERKILKYPGFFLRSELAGPPVFPNWQIAGHCETFLGKSGRGQRGGLLSKSVCCQAGQLASSSLVSPQWKERTNSLKFSSDLTRTSAHTHTHTHTLSKWMNVTFKWIASKNDTESSPVISINLQIHGHVHIDTQVISG